MRLLALLLRKYISNLYLQTYKKSDSEAEMIYPSSDILFVVKKNRHTAQYANNIIMFKLVICEHGVHIIQNDI